MDDIWERVGRGHHVAVLGLSPGEPPAALGLRLVRVSCDVPAATLGPLLEARAKIEQILDSDAPLLDLARGRVVAGLRRHLLGDAATLAAEGSLVSLWNRLAAQPGRRWALILESLDAADAPTLDALRHVLARPGWLALPLVLVFRSAEPTGAAAALLEVVRAALGPEAVVRTPDAPAAPSAPSLRALPAEVLRVLRTGAVIGSGFEASLVSEVLGLPPLDVLECLQRAADAGLPLEDRGEGRFHLPDATIAELHASILPSLALALHRRVAEVLAASPPEVASSPPRAIPRELPEEAPPPTMQAPPAPLRESIPVPVRVSEPRFAPQTSPLASEPPEPMDAEPPATDLNPSVRLMARADAYAAEPPSVTELERPRPPPVVEPATPVPPSRRVEAPRPRGDEARAARHLAAAGELEAGAERYLAAARQAAGMSAYPQSAAHCKSALALLDGLPASPRRRRLRLAVLLELGRLEWQAAGPDARFTLAGALQILDAARAQLERGDPPEVHARVAALIAGICYELGDLRSLERALEELTTASRRLLDAGDALGAARLLNDQAAVYLRLGDPVQATHLLEESRKVFEPRAVADVAAMVEMAETDHLLATIPLLVAARPGRKDDALSSGLDHALAAERAFTRLSAPRELGRVWETMGRLELGKGRLERAEKRLSAAVEVQQSIGDLVGLARSMATLAEVLAAGGQRADALALLGDAAAIDLEKGSPVGLALDRRIFDKLQGGLAVGAEEGELAAEVARRIEEAESVLGRLDLPGERSGSQA